MERFISRDRVKRFLDSRLRGNDGALKSNSAPRYWIACARLRGNRPCRGLHPE
jgi:hypothetical protein